MPKNKKNISKNKPAMNGNKLKNNLSNSLSVEILKITDTGTVITLGSSQFDYGVLFQHHVQYKRNPIPVDLASAYICDNLKIGQKIDVTIEAVNHIDGKKVGILKFDIAGLNEEEDAIFNNMMVGEKYQLSIFDYNDEYITLQVPNTSLRGYIDSHAIPNPEIGMIVELQLSRKGRTAFQLMQFENILTESGNEKQTTSQDSVDVIFNRMFERELDLISEEDEVWVKKLISNYPNLNRNSKYLADIKHLYCRCSPQASFAVNQFKNTHPNYLESSNFFVAFNQNDLSLILFNCDYVVLKMKIKGNDTLWLSEFYFDQTDIQAKYICDENQRGKLLIEGYKIHILDSYNAIPNTFNLQEILAYILAMTHFHYDFLKDLNAKRYEKQSNDSKDFAILRSLITYEKRIEEKKVGQRILVSSESNPHRTIAQEYPNGVAYVFELGNEDYQLLCGKLDEDEDLYVSIVDIQNNDKPLRSGRLFYNEDTKQARIEFPENKDINSDLIRAGFYIKKRTSIEHLDIQIDAISSLFRRKEQSFYDTIIPNSFEAPDVRSYINKVNFFDEKIKNATSGNNQPLAVLKALGNKQVLLIQGPPGTGKTTVIVEIIRQLAKEGKKVLVCSQAHAAVNNIVEKIHDLDDLSFIAVGNEGEENAWGLGFDIEEYKKFLSNNATLISKLIAGEEIDENHVNLLFKYSSQYGIKYSACHSYIIKYYNEYKELYSNADIILENLLDKSELTGRLLDSYRYQMQDVILGTCIGIGMNRNVREMHFDTVIIDEAAKANLAESLVPMRLADRYILVGDDKQLPPYTDRNMISDFVKQQPEEIEIRADETTALKVMSKSLFELYHERLKGNTDNVVMLNYQYRMHPEIGSFISNVFYDGLVNMGENTVSQYISLQAPYDEPIHFVDTDRRPDNREKRSNQSFYNECEANIISNEILPLVSRSGLSDGITSAIITPYSAQRDYLRKLLRGSEYANSIYTIDSIQGMEFDIVIFSFVRSFSEKSDKVVGFLDDMRRLNVSLSRAKKKLILVGNKPTLTRAKAHRDTGLEGLNPLNVFEKLTESYIYYDNPSKGRVFHEKYGHDSMISCSITKMEKNMLYFTIKDDVDFRFRMPIGLVEESQLQGINDIMVEIQDYDKAGRPVFRIHSYHLNGNFVRVKSFTELTTGLNHGSIISCMITENTHKLTAMYNGCHCKIPAESCSNEFKEDTIVGQVVKARVHSLDAEGEIITVYPIQTSYVQPIEDSEISAFFFEVTGKDYPDKLTVKFDNGESGTFLLKNSFHWASLRIGDVYSDFHRSKYNSEELTYNRWQQSQFVSEHEAGDIVKGRVTYYSRKMCICWAQGVVGRILNFQNKRVNVGEEYDLSVTYNESNQIAFNL